MKKVFNVVEIELVKSKFELEFVKSKCDIFKRVYIVIVKVVNIL